MGRNGKGSGKKPGGGKKGKGSRDHQNDDSDEDWNPQPGSVDPDLCATHPG